jgi:hypothetical protein
MLSTEDFEHVIVKKTHVDFVKKKLDEIYLRVIRRITKNMTSYPGLALMADLKEGGLGIETPMLHAHKCKLKHLPLISKCVASTTLLVKPVNKKSAAWPSASPHAPTQLNNKTEEECE